MKIIPIYSTKKRYICGVLFLVLSVLTACGTDAEGEDGEIQIVESEPIEASDRDAPGPADIGMREDGMADRDGQITESGDNSAAGPEVSVNSENVETEGMEADPYVGEYNASDVEEPGMEIQKTEAGTYQILIRIFRLASFDDVSGMLTEKGLEFTALAPDGSETGGVITLDGDVATVTFNPGWSGFEGVYSFQYDKTSDTPNMDPSAY